MGARALRTPDSPATAEEQKLDALYETYWQDWLALNPQEALVQGDHPLRSRVRRSLEDGWRRNVTSMLKRYRAALMTFDPAPLPEDARISYEMLRYELTQALSYYGTDGV